MKKVAFPVAIVVLLVAVMLHPATVAQDALPTPRGQLGGREPLVLTPVLPLPTPVPTVPPTATPVPTTTPSPAATPTPTPTTTPTPTPSPMPLTTPSPTTPPIVPVDITPKATATTVPSLPGDAAEAATPAAVPTAAVQRPVGGTANGDAATAPVGRALAAAVPAVVTVLIDGSAGLRVGTGVVVVDERHVVTSAALVGGATAGELVAADGTRSYASVVGVDVESGLALLEASVEVAAPLAVADREVAVGETVVGVGTADGAFPSTVAVGTVGLSRALAGGGGPSATLLIQHDAALPGRSWGAALVGLDGTLVGLTIPIVTAGDGLGLPPVPPLPGAGDPGIPLPGAGEPGVQLPGDLRAQQDVGVAGGGPLAFAVPAPTIDRVVRDLLDDEEVAYPFMGVTFEANVLWPGGPPDGTVTTLEVVPDGPAAAAGIRPGDVVVGFEGGPLTPIRPFQLALLAREPGQTASVTVSRDGGERVVEVVLAERPQA